MIFHNVRQDFITFFSVSSTSHHKVSILHRLSCLHQDAASQASQRIESTAKTM